jgi:hypothetical protein
MRIYDYSWGHVNTLCCCLQNVLVPYFLYPKLQSRTVIDLYSGFWTRVRALAVRAPIFLGSLIRETGAARHPAPPITASLILPAKSPSFFFGGGGGREIRESVPLLK